MFSFSLSSSTEKLLNGIDPCIVFTHTILTMFSQNDYATKLFSGLDIRFVVGCTLLSLVTIRMDMVKEINPYLCAGGFAVLFLWILGQFSTVSVFLYFGF